LYPLKREPGVWIRKVLFSAIRSYGLGNNWVKTSHRQKTPFGPVGNISSSVLPEFLNEIIPFGVLSVDDI